MLQSRYNRFIIIFSLKILIYNLLKITNNEPRSLSNRCISINNNCQQQYAELTLEHKQQEWQQIEEWVLEYQKQFKDEYKNDPEIVEIGKQAAEKLIKQFYPLFKKYLIIITTGTINWDDKEAKDFVSNFINDRALLNALHRKKQTSEYRKSIYESFNFIKEAYGKNDPEEIMIDLQMLFLVVAKRYKQVGKNFCAYVNNSYKFELARHIKKQFQNPLNISYKISEYSVETMKDDSSELYEDTYYENETGLLSQEWIDGYCNEAFQTLTKLERKIFAKYYLENLNDNQIAQELGLHLNTINSKRRKGLEKVCAYYKIDPKTIKRTRKSGKNAITMTQY